jgi:hypothetical protein
LTETAKDPSKEGLPGEIVGDEGSLASCKRGKPTAKKARCGKKPSVRGVRRLDRAARSGEETPLDVSTDRISG